MLLALNVISISTAHEPKEYTVLLTSEGMTPSKIPEDALVETDFIFFRNVDNTEGASHMVRFDADGDGIFDGADDISTSWLNSSCELDETGQKMDPNCEVAEHFQMAPENGILPGNVSFLHQVRVNSTLTETVSVVFLGVDEHAQQPPEITQPDSAAMTSERSNKNLLTVVLFCSIMGIMAILPLISNPKG